PRTDNGSSSETHSCAAQSPGAQRRRSPAPLRKENSDHAVPSRNIPPAREPRASPILSLEILPSPCCYETKIMQSKVEPPSPTVCHSERSRGISECPAWLCPTLRVA